MARRPLGLWTPPSANPPESDGSGLAATLAGFRQRLQDVNAGKYSALAEVRNSAMQRATPTAQIAFNPRTNKYVVGGQEFDANDIGALKALAEAPDLPETPIPDGLEALTQQQVRDRFQRIYDNAEVDTSIQSRLRGMGEAIAGIPRGIASVFGADVANPLEGSADAWRRDNLTLREQAGRMHRPTESLVGAANAFGQAIETGVPVLAAGALGTLGAGPGGGIAAGAAVAGSMAAESQGDEAEARIAQALAQATPEQLQGNPEYMALRRAGNDHQSSVQELVRRGRTTAARYGAAIGGVSGAVAGPAGRFMARGLPMFGNRFAAGAGDDIGENLIRALRGTSGPGLTGTVRTGFAPALRSSAGLGVLGAGTEGTQEFFETDVSQGLADVSAGMSRGYQFNQYGTLDDFVGGAIGGAPFGAVGGLRTPTALPVRPTQQQQGTADPGLNAALGGAVAPPNPRSALADMTRGLVEGDRAAGAQPAQVGQPQWNYPTMQPPSGGQSVDLRGMIPGMGLPAQQGMTPDLFGSTPSTVRMNDPQRDAMVEMQELQRVIPQLLLRAQRLADPQQREAAGMQLEQLRMRYAQLEQQFGPLPEPDTGPMFDANGFPVQQQQPDLGQTLDLFGRAPSDGPGAYDTVDVADPTGNALGIARDRMAARYGTQPMFDEAGLPTYGERWQYTGFEGMDPGAVEPEGGFNPDVDMPQEPAPQGDRAVGLRQARTPLDRLPLPQRRAAEQTTLQRRADDSARDPALLTDQQAQATREREQQIAALQADKAGLEGWLASAETARENKAGPAPARIKYARDALARIEEKLAALAPPTPEPNVTSAEPIEDIEAQIDAMLDPNTTKDAVWVSKGTPMPKRKLPGVKKVVTKAGTLLTTNPEKASALEADKARASDEAFIKELLDLPVSKKQMVASGERVKAVTARTKTGAVAAQALTPESTVSETVATVKAQAGPNAKTTVEDPATPMADRMRRASTTSSRQPTPDQTAGAVIASVPDSVTGAARIVALNDLIKDLKQQSNRALKADRPSIEKQIITLQGELDALKEAAKRPAPTPADEGSSSKGGLPRGETERSRSGDSTSRTPAEKPPVGGAPDETIDEETQRVLTASTKELEAIARVFDSDPGDAAFGTEADLDLSPTATPAQTEVKVEGADAPVLSAAEMTVEVEGGESQVKPSAILDAFRKRIENLNLLKACLLK
jgi:hypothetical protein